MIVMMTVGVMFNMCVLKWHMFYNVMVSMCVVVMAEAGNRRISRTRSLPDLI